MQEARFRGRFYHYEEGEIILTTIICNRCFIEKETGEFYGCNKICKVCMLAHTNSPEVRKRKNIALMSGWKIDIIFLSSLIWRI